MPITYRIDRALHLVVSEWVGDITIREARAHFAALAADPDFDPTMHHLSNALGAVAALTLGELRLLAFESPFSDSGRAAIVASTDLVFGVSKQYEALTDRAVREIQVFRGLEDARSWLGIDGDPAE